jgi:uncharacterized protein
MLEIRPNCEHCNKDLAPGSNEAMICSFECTYCTDCALNALEGRCPNCGGELKSRPIRPESELERHPASKVRVFNPRRARQTNAGPKTLRVKLRFAWFKIKQADQSTLKRLWASDARPVHMIIRG